MIGVYECINYNEEKKGKGPISSARYRGTLRYGLRILATKLNLESEKLLTVSGQAAVTLRICIRLVLRLVLSASHHSEIPTYPCYLTFNTPSSLIYLHLNSLSLQLLPSSFFLLNHISPTLRNQRQPFDSHHIQSKSHIVAPT